MPRTHARMQFGMWRKPGHEKVSKDARLMYQTILLDETVNQAGVVRLSLDMWADDAAMTAAEAQAAIDELCRLDFVIVDGWELLVRTFIRNDTVADQPNVLRNALECARQIRSPKLRSRLAEELRKLAAAPPPREMKNGRMFVYPDPHAVADELDPDPPPPGSDAYSDGSNNPPWNPSGTLPVNPSREGLGGTLGGSGSGSGSGSCLVDRDFEKPRAHASARTRETGQARAIANAGAPHSPTAHRLVEAYAATCNRRPPTKILTQLAVETDALLNEDWPEPDIAAALTAWGSKSLGPGSLQSVAHEVANRRTKPQLSITGRAVASVDAAFDEWEARRAARPDNVRALPGRD